MTDTPKMGAVEWLMLLVLSVLWGGSFFFSAVALSQIGPYTLVLLRVGIAALVLFIYIKLTGRKLPRGVKVWQAFLILGLINNVIPFSLLFWGQTQIASSLASILNATTPIFTILVAHFLTQDEKIKVSSMIGIALGLAGVAIMLGVLRGFETHGPVLPMLACVGAALSYGFASVFGRRFKAMNMGFVRTAFGQLTTSTVCMLPLVLVFDTLPVIAALTWATIGSVLALAVFSTALAYLLFFRILSVGGATNISLVTLLVPASAILLGVMVLGERLETDQLIGMALIASGLVVIDGRLFKKWIKN